MTENRAIALVFAIGLAVEAGAYYLLSGWGVEGQLVVLMAVFCIIGITVSMGMIGTHYERKGSERGEDRSGD